MSSTIVRTPERGAVRRPPPPPSEPSTDVRPGPNWLIAFVFVLAIVLVITAVMWRSQTHQSWTTYSPAVGGFTIAYPSNYRVRTGVPTFVPFGKAGSTVAFTSGSTTLAPTSDAPVLGVNIIDAVQPPHTYTPGGLARRLVSSAHANPRVLEVRSGDVSFGGLAGVEVVERDRSGTSLTVLLGLSEDRIVVLRARTGSSTPVLEDPIVQEFLGSVRSTL